MDLLTRSIEIILENQHPSGSYVACPNFPTYHYCWLRDGSFVAYAMDRVGEFLSAERFFLWVDQVISRYSSKVDALAEKLCAGENIHSNEYLHTRYTLDGYEDTKEADWGNFQMDGYGTWLWALASHIQLSGDYSLLSKCSASISTTIKYLRLVWNHPNYDCWEEYPEYIHPYSVAAVYAGFAAMERIYAVHPEYSNSFPLNEYASEIKEFVRKNGVVDQVLVKHIRPSVGFRKASPVIESGVDASLVGIICPYSVFELDDPIAIGTISKIEEDLRRKNGGIYRYLRDQYYGGGEWILLTAWLGWYYGATGQRGKAAEIIKWIEGQADPAGNLPEQVSDHTLSPQYYPKWVNQWGEIASPLLWSHAMYVILKKSM